VSKMDNYILQRLRADAGHLLALSENERKLPHPGVKGRFRELLIDNLLSPWLPPDVRCGTGMIIDNCNGRTEATQDDIVLYAKSLCPPVLASDQAPEGVFLYNSVLARIEAKSTLNRSELVKFVSAASEIFKLRVNVQTGCDKQHVGALNLLFAYKSDLTSGNDSELTRLIDVMKEKNISPVSGIVSMICVPGRGFYKIGLDNGRRVWQKHQSNDPCDHIAWFVACVSNSCFKYLVERQGRDITNSLEAGIGSYLNHPFVSVSD
jgi:hypothetical protein